MKHKIGLYILSLWLLFLSIIILNTHHPEYCEGKADLLEFIFANLISVTSFIAMLLGAFHFLRFNYFISGTKDVPSQIIEINNINYEHLTFLTTYIIPLICFDLTIDRYAILLPLLILGIGVIYIKTNLYFANPTLALLGFHIYKVDTLTKKSIIIITKSNLNKGDWVDTISLDNNIFYGKLNTKRI